MLVKRAVALFNRAGIDKQPHLDIDKIRRT